jgi:hypothetical protein
MSSVLVTLVALSTPVRADEEPISSDAPAVEPAPAETPAGTVAAADGSATVAKKRPYLMEVNFRGRYMSIPEGVLDLGAWAHDNDEYPARPDVSAYTLGLEFVIKEKSANGIFYVEFLKPLIEDGYWDDIDHGSETNLDGSWIEFEDFAFVTIGADYAYELHATNWLSFLFGAGLGVGIKLGEIHEWQAGEDPADPEGDNDNADPTCGPSPTPSYDRADPDNYGCEYDASLYGDVPVLPFLDVNVGVRFSINNRASIRLEGGVHNMLYGGAALGVVF